MDALSVESQTVELLSHISGQKLNQDDITPEIMFLASLAAVLLGVLFVDGIVADPEKQRLVAILYRFSVPESHLRRLTHLMIKGIKEQQIYKKINDLLILTHSLTKSQKLLLICFGYEMSVADGQIAEREQKYLEIVAHHLEINPKLLSLIGAGFTHTGNFQPDALKAIHYLLKPEQFQQLDMSFVKAAREILALFATQAELKSTQN